MTFDTLGLSTKVVEAVKQAGYTTPTPIQEEAITEQHIHSELASAVAGLSPGHESDDKITLFKFVGLVVHDVATEVYALNLARRRDMGTMVTP